MKYQPPFEPSFAGPVDGIYNSNPAAPYKNGSPATGEEGSIPPMEAVDHPMRELTHLIEHSGQTPSHEDLQQVRKAVKKMIEDGTASTSLAGDAVAIWEGLRAGTGVHKIRALVAGTNITLELVEQPAESGEYQIRISATGGGGGGGGEIDLANVGDGAQVYKGMNDDTAELRTIKGANGIAVTQNANDVTVDGSAFGQFFPFFPEIETVDAKLVVTPTTGQVVIAGGQSFIHRGTRRVQTSATDEGLRTFATAASKTYHLRWRWNNGAPAYALLDLANGAYNPGALAEDNPSFDSTYDDMLIARVVTSGGNVPTVTTYENRARLMTTVHMNSDTYDVADGGNKAYGKRYTGTLNWARTPRAWSCTGNFYAALAGAAVVQGGTNIVCDGSIAPAISHSDPPLVTREKFDASVWTDWNATPANFYSMLQFTASA